ncbi:ABC transporter permease [Herbiconiux sp. L3-i23]|jgi:ABC-2 type transport system permease protein|uniref:ABC transporter permease n=1 Tax=Herbiconiux sp. L3-i23 TaxID=2905871 RepID=UPI00206DE541|nr:ABC transporter permease [Herbiconiux sp. L3-i23]BDI23414.1 ABC transporter permease [Herbiconiux sp. L3-i23]
MSNPRNTKSGANPASTVWLVAEREIRVRLRTKSFVISTGILLAMVLAAVIFGGFQARQAAEEAGQDIPVAVVGTAADALPGGGGFEAVDAADQAAAEELVRDGDVDAALVPSTGGASEVTIIADEEAPASLVAALSSAPEVQLLDPEDPNYWLNYLVAYAFGLVFFLAALTFGSTIATSVVEEKSTRVVEILMSAIPVRTLLAGKVLGNSLLAFGQTAATVALALIGLTVTDQTELLSLLGAPVVWFVAFFVIGFTLIAALFAATGAMVSRQEDIGSTTTPVTMLVMLPFFAVIFLFDNQLWMTVLSYFPFSSPVAMPVRLFQGTALWWEPILSLVVLALSTFAAIVVGSKIYENSLLRMGARVTLREALKG